MAKVRAALDRLTDPSVKAVLNEEAYSHVRPVLRETLTNNPYACSPEAADVLEKLGIATNPFAIKVHSHAAVKSIENTLLERVGFNLPKEPCTFLFLKRSKLRFLRRGPNNNDIFLNLTIEPRDFQRYEEETIVSTWTRISTRCAYISDTLHFFSRKMLVDLFFHNPCLDTLYATVVLPPEALHKHPSMEPDLYTINYNYGGFQYIPGNHGGGSYSHEFHQLDWLKVGHINHDLIQLTVQMIESLGANHLFLIRRGHYITPKVRTFTKDQMVLLPQIFHPANLNTHKPLSKTKAMQLFLYCKSVKNVTERDIYAKIRQLIRTSELSDFDPQELVHIVNYFYFLSKLDSVNSYSDILSLPIWSKALLPIKSKITILWEKLTGERPFQQLLKALGWKTFTYSVPVESFTVAPSPTDPFIENENVQDTYDDVAEQPISEDSPKPLTPEEAVAAHPDLPWSPWIPILLNHNAKCDSVQKDPEGNVILPILNSKKLDKVHPKVEPELLALLDKLHRTPTMVPIDQNRARAYGSDVKNLRIGALLKKQSKDWLDGFALKTENFEMEVPMAIIHGAGGSGKSHAIQQWMNNLQRKDRKVTVVLPTTELRNDWTAKVPRLEQAIFKTFEKALVQPCGPIVIFDDYSKLPQGYIEAFLATKKNVDLAILTGDSRQSYHHEANSDAYTAHLEPSIEVYSDYCRYYLNITHRNKPDLANKLGVYSCSTGNTSFTMSSQAVSGMPILSPSLMKKTALGDMGQRSMTYAGCQGLTAKKIQILLDNNTPLCSDNVIYTALSRATDHIHFINTGPNSTDFWEKLDSTPYLKTFLDTVREEKMNDIITADASPAPVPAPTTHFPKANPTEVIENYIAELPEKHEREIYNNSLGHSNAVQTDDSVVQLFAHQQAKDETLYWATIDARLTITSPEENYKEFHCKKDIGDILFMNYKIAMNLPQDPIPFNGDLWNLCRQEIENTYLKKSAAALINAATRQSPDFDSQAIQLFLKSQWVKKTEKIGAIQIKPGQTIASFMQQTVMVFGTMARYMRKFRNKHQPRKIFINCETTSEDFNSFVLDEWNFNRPSFSNDFTAFDQSQDGSILQFEIIKAKFHNIPEDVIESYIQIKTNAKIFLGTLAIMRLSGEGPTFDANTEANIAYTHTKFSIPSDVAQIYAGDDMAIDYICQVKPSFSLVENQLKLTSKPVYNQQKQGDFAEFCGWTISPKGIIKKPEKMNMSIELNKRIGKFHEVKRSYALDHAFAYSLGDELHELYSESEADHHQLATRALILAGQASALDVLNYGLRELH
ncbi:MAG: RNA replication protein [Xinjiang alphaflexivirus 2]|nr:MAG: RNA replication protein [Xinjiang alphaflexivirus 2]